MNSLLLFNLKKTNVLSSFGKVAVLVGCGWLTLNLVVDLRAQTYNAADDFSLARNPNGVWSYGTLSSVPGGTFTPFTRGIANYPYYVTSTWDNNGTSPNYAAVVQTSAPLYAYFPNLLTLTSESLNSDARWTAPTTGVYNIAGYFYFGRETLIASVIEDFGTTLFTTGNPYESNSIQVFNFHNVKLSAGAVLDFTAGGESGSGAADLAVAITLVNPTPNTVVATIPVGLNPEGLVVTPDNEFVLVANSSDGISNVVSVLNAQTGQLAGTSLYGGVPGRGLAITPNGKSLYISNFNSGTVSMIATSDIAFTKAISGAAIVGALGIATTPDGKQVYVANNERNWVSVITTSTNQVSPTVITVGNSPSYVAFTPNGTKALVTNSQDNTVSVINVASQTVAATIPVGASPQGIVIAPDGREAYVNNGTSISVIDIATQKVSSINLGGKTGYQSALTPDGKSLYVPVVPTSGPGTLAVISTATGAVTGNPIPIGQQPYAVAIARDGKYAYVTNYADGTVSMISIP